MPNSSYNRVEDEKDLEAQDKERAKSKEEENIPLPAHIEFNADKILNRIDAVRGSVSVGLLGSNAAEVTDLEFSLIGVAITELLAAFLYAITSGMDFFYKLKEKRNLLAAKRLQYYDKYTRSRSEKAARRRFYTKPARTRRTGLIPQIAYAAYDTFVGSKKEKPSSSSPGTNSLDESTREELAKANILTKDELYDEMVLRNNKTFGFTNNYFVNLSRFAVLAASITGGILLLLLGLNNLQTIDDATSNERLMLEVAIWLIAGSLGFSRLINGEVQQEVDSDEWRSTFTNAVKKVENDDTPTFSYMDTFALARSANPLPHLSRYVPAGLEFKRINGDGHCFFAAVEKQTDVKVIELRKQTASYLEQNFEDLKKFYDGSEDEFKAHIKAIKEGNEWADHLEIRALAKSLKRSHCRSTTKKYYYEESATDGEEVIAGSEAPVFLHYNGYSHYDALTLLPEADWKEV